MLSLPTPIPDPSGYLIKLVHEQLVISHDFELTQKVRQVYYTNDNGDFGIPLKDSINLNPNLSPEQKVRQLQVFKDQIRTVSTAGYMVNPSTGEIVELNESGLYPEGSIPEREIWLNVLAEQVPGEKLSEKVQALMIQSMQKMADRNRI